MLTSENTFFSPYTMNNQLHLPSIGFGTYPLKGMHCQSAVNSAYQLGYRLFDTATFYQNFGAIASGLTEANREDIFLVSKVWPDRQTADGLVQDLNITLAELNTDYLDAYLLHWPDSRLPIMPIIHTVQSFLEKGLIRSFGLSNVTVFHIERLLELGMPISFVQNEMNPGFFDKALSRLCQQNNIIQLAWAPLARGKIFTLKHLNEIGQQHQKSPAQIALRWLQQLGAIPLPGSQSPIHQAENLDISDFELSMDEMNIITEHAASGQRERVTKDYGLGFEDEFDFNKTQCWPIL